MGACVYCRLTFSKSYHFYANESKGVGLMIYVAVSVIAFLIGYAIWHLYDILTTNISLKKTDKTQEDRLIPYPFDLTPEKVEIIQKISFYVGLFVGILFYIKNGFQ